MNDELNYIKILEKAGVNRKQAEAQVSVLGKAMNDDIAKQSKIDQKFFLMNEQMEHQFALNQAEMGRKFDAMQAEMDKKFELMQVEMDRRFDAIQAEFKLLRQEMQTMKKSFIILNALSLAFMLGLFKALEYYFSHYPMSF